jgi:hypothetical protein
VPETLSCGYEYSMEQGRNGQISESLSSLSQLLLQSHWQRAIHQRDRQERYLAKVLDRTGSVQKQQNLLRSFPFSKALATDEHTRGWNLSSLLLESAEDILGDGACSSLKSR